MISRILLRYYRKIYSFFDHNLALNIFSMLQQKNNEPRIAKREGLIAVSANRTELLATNEVKSGATRLVNLSGVSRCNENRNQAGDLGISGR